MRSMECARRPSGVSLFLFQHCSIPGPHESWRMINENDMPRIRVIVMQGVISFPISNLLSCSPTLVRTVHKCNFSA